MGADDGHLHFEVAPDGACGLPRYCAQFPSLWSGCRLTHGVLRGRVGFEVRVERAPPTSHMELQPEDVGSPGLRVGWSVAGSSTLLGKMAVLEVLDFNTCKSSHKFLLVCDILHYLLTSLFWSLSFTR